MSAVLIPQQPNLRAFVVFNDLPAGCIAFPIVNEHSDPLLRPGDIAVIDTNDRRADHDLFLVEGADHRRVVRRAILWIYSRSTGATARQLANA